MTFYDWLFQYMGKMKKTPEHMKEGYAGWQKTALDDAQG